MAKENYDQLQNSDFEIKSEICFEEMPYRSFKQKKNKNSVEERTMSYNENKLFEVVSEEIVLEDFSNNHNEVASNSQKKEANFGRIHKSKIARGCSDEDVSSSKQKWTLNETLEFIKMYKRSTLLWDAKCSDYCNHHRRTQAVKSLAEIFERSEGEILKKIHTLRTRMTLEMGTTRKVTGDGEYYDSSWVFFKPLQFIISDLKLPTGNENSKDKINPHFSNTKTEPTNPKRETSFKAKETEQKRIIQKVLRIMDQPTDALTIFGKFVAAELRDLNSEEKREKLKLLIHKSIIEISALDKRMHKAQCLNLDNEFEESGS